MVMKTYGVLGSQRWADKKCHWCGQHIQPRDQITLIIPSDDYKTKYKRLAKNYIIHTSEFDMLSHECEDDETLLSKLGEHPTPRIKHNGLCEIDARMLDTARLVATERGFIRENHKGFTYHFHLPHTSAYIRYNALTHEFSVEGSSHLNMAGMLEISHLETSMQNRMNELLGG